MIELAEESLVLFFGCRLIRFRARSRPGIEIAVNTKPSIHCQAGPRLAMICVHFGRIVLCVSAALLKRRSARPVCVRTH